MGDVPDDSSLPDGADGGDGGDGERKDGKSKTHWMNKVIAIEIACIVALVLGLVASLVKYYRQYYRRRRRVQQVLKQSDTLGSTPSKEEVAKAVALETKFHCSMDDDDKVNASANADANDSKCSEVRLDVAPRTNPTAVPSPRCTGSRVSRSISRGMGRGVSSRVSVSGGYAGSLAAWWAQLRSCAHQEHPVNANATSTSTSVRIALSDV